MILADWVFGLQQAITKANERIDCAEMIFDELFKLKAIDPNIKVQWEYAEGQSTHVSLLSWLLIHQAPISIFNKFISNGIGTPNTIDSIYDFNIPMQAAMFGNLEALDSILKNWGPEKAALAFNFRKPTDFNPTVLHITISQAQFKGGAKTAIEMIEFLVKNGANPDQRSKYHNLIQEVDFWMRSPSGDDWDAEVARAELPTIRKYLVENLPKLRALCALRNMSTNTDCNPYLQ